MTQPAPTPPTNPASSGVELSPKLKQRLVVGVVFGLLVYLGIALWADGPSIASALREFPAKWILVA